jgi:hypothetical protein
VLEFLNNLGTRIGVGIGLSYRPARLHIGWRNDYLHSILGLLKSLKIRALAGQYDKQGCRTDPPGYELIPGFLKRFTNTGSDDSKKAQYTAPC